MYTTDVGTTWAGTHTFGARRLYLPGSLSEAAEIVGSLDRVRAVGTRHSFNDIADGETMISLVQLEPDVQLDEQARTVSVCSGTRYGVLASWLHDRGWALRNMGSLPHISIGGATATGTHGSGDTNGILSTAVAGVQLINAEGEVLDFDRSHPEFAGIVPSLGALGIITRLTVDIEPTYEVRQDVFRDLPWEAVIGELDTVMAAGYSVSIFTVWDEPTASRVLVKSRLDVDAEVPTELFGAPAMHHGDPELAALGANRTVQGGIPGPWLERLPHFRVDANPSNGDEIQSEYFIDRRHGAAAMDALRGLASEIAPHLIASEIRSTAADNLWLSMAYERPSLAIHFTWLNRPDALTNLLPRIEKVLAPFDARPHWGKTFVAQADLMKTLYPRLPDFQALRNRMDPTGKFSNDYLRRVIGS